MTSYALNTTEAKQAEYTGSRIDETGKYAGRFIYAEDIVAGTGTKGIEFNFESADGRKCRTTLYTEKKDGEPIPGRKMLMAMMTCMKVRDLKTSPAKVTKWDYDSGADVVKDTQVFKDLHDKPIGLLLQAEEYAKSDGSGTGWKMVIAGAYEAATELTASEILDKRAKPEQLARMVSALKDKPLKGAQAPRAAAAGGAPVGGSRFADLDDDIPFANPYRGRLAYSV